MSGSPIIQNGKLIGSITHAIISAPTRNYGVTISAMLDSENAAQLIDRTGRKAGPVYVPDFMSLPLVTSF